ncbi:Elongation of very long chain fatty acids protein 4 [Blomia tropicalis]|nr:Elongation of very long chain fatty acids protein 4 [Blomia tropicalis]
MDQVLNNFNFLLDWLNDIHQVANRTMDSSIRLFDFIWTRIGLISDTYHYLDSFSDPKLRQWPLMGSPIEPLVILAFYFLMVHYGQSFVHHKVSKRGGSSSESHYHNRNSFVNRPLFSLILVTYNISMSALNAWISFELLYCGYKRKYNFLCQLVYTKTDDLYERRIAEAIWWYFASKGIELLDTFFIIIKRKQAQLTFLHIYHHSSMFIVWWVGAKFVPGGSALSGALVNCVVHIIMYGYYALSTLGPSMKPFLWWKKYLTILQLIQFTAGVSLGLNSIITQCPFTRWMQYVFVAYAFSFLILFGNFYRTTYIGGKRNQTSKQQQKQLNKTPTHHDLAAILRATIPSMSSSSTTSVAAVSSSSSSSSPSSSLSMPVVSNRGKRSKQSKMTMAKSKHHHGQIGRKNKIKSS